MGNLSGYVELLITKTDGTDETVVVDSNKFGLEDGDDWSRDRDDGEWCADFQFIAFQVGFDLMLNFNIHGNNIKDYSLNVRKTEFESADIRQVEIVQDNLEATNFSPPLDENDS